MMEKTIKGEQARQYFLGCEQTLNKALFNKNANQLREDYGIGKKENLRDCFSVEDLQAVQSIEMLVSGLINFGWGYDSIKNFIMENAAKRLAG